MPSRKIVSIPFFALLIAIAPATAGPPTAVDDAYETAAGENLSVDEPGVLDNDTDPDEDPLTAVLVDGPASGGVVNLFDDGSFEYEPPDGFLGIDTFTYRASDGSELSNVATASIAVTGNPGFGVFLDPAAFAAALSNLGYETTVESFEDDAAWGAVRSTVVGGSMTAPAVHSLGIEWRGNNPDSGVTTSNGPPRTGAWAFYELPHGSYATGTDCHLPGNCGDGFVGTASPKLYAVGAWISAIYNSKVEFVLDGDRIADFGDGSTITSGHKFFGVLDPAGFRSFEVRELEGTVGDQKYIWADDFTFATPPGITLSVVRGPGPGDVRLQWLGGSPTFSVFRSADPALVTASGSELGQTTGRQWDDQPAPGGLVYYRVTP